MSPLELSRRTAPTLLLIGLGVLCIAASVLSAFHQEQVKSMFPALWKLFMPLGPMGLLMFVAGLVGYRRVSGRAG